MTDSSFDKAAALAFLTALDPDADAWTFQTFV